MTHPHFKREGWLYALAFLIAAALRLIQLGGMPFSDSEAAPALQALQLARGLRPALDPHPLYILSTSFLFFLNGGGTDFLARLIPALAGSLMVFTPLVVRRIRPRPGLILAFFIAVDPGLVALSRQAASPILAVTCLILAWGFFEQRRHSLAGVCAGLALLCGPSLWTGLLGLAITAAIMQGVSFRSAPAQSEGEDAPVPASPAPAFDYKYKPLLLPMFVTFLAAGTFFLLVPNGLSAAFSSIPAFLARWRSVSDVPATRLLLALAVYHLPMLLLAVFAMVRGWRTGSRLIISLNVWLLVSLLIALFLPSRQVGDLVWTLLPLNLLAALELVRSVYTFADERVEILGVAALTAFIWAFSWLDFSGLVWVTPGSREYILRFSLLVGALLLLVFSLLLIAAGWSIRIARIGGTWGFLLAAGALVLGGAVGSAGLRGPAFPELWWQPSLPLQGDLLEDTVRDVSEWGTGNDYSAAIVIAGFNSPALEWTLRDHPVTVSQTLDVSSAPQIVITPQLADPSLAASYRGQDFTWRQMPNWNFLLPENWVRWVSLRDVSQSGESIILWVREDLFFGAAVTP